MADVPLAEALLLWNPGFNGETPAFAVRPLGHPDYDRYRSQVGACFSSWHEKDEQGQLLQLMVEAWHVAAFYAVPIDMIHTGLLAVREYRDTLADDCLPERFRHERD